MQRNCSIITNQTKDTRCVKRKAKRLWLSIRFSLRCPEDVHIHHYRKQKGKEKYKKWYQIGLKENWSGEKLMFDKGHEDSDGYAGKKGGYVIRKFFFPFSTSLKAINGRVFSLFNQYKILWNDVFLRTSKNIRLYFLLFLSNRTKNDQHLQRNT